MNKIDRIEKYLHDAQDFLGHNLTSENSKFEAWNHSLLRFINANYDNDTYLTFKNRKYTLSIWPINTPESTFVKAFENDLNTTIEELKNLLEEEKDNDDFEDTLNKTIEQKPDNTQLILNLFNRFHLVCRQLLKRHNSRSTLKVNDEYDVQDLMHSLLYVYFDDIRAEEWTPSYAGGCSRMDFLLKKEKIVIEIKKTRDGLQDRQIGEQLIIDIDKYKTHPYCKTLLCFVYDPDNKIANPKGIENDLSKTTDGLKVIIVVSQK